MSGGLLWNKKGGLYLRLVGYFRKGLLYGEDEGQKDTREAKHLHEDEIQDHAYK